MALPRVQLEYKETNTQSEERSTTPGLADLLLAEGMAT